MKRSNILIAVYLVLIFGSGVVVGAFATKLYYPSTVLSKQPARVTPEEWRRGYVKELQSRLNLTPEQLTQLNQCLDETGAKVHTEHERHVGQMKSLREEQVSIIRAMLDERQKAEYDKLRQEHERARAQMPGKK